MKRSSPSNPSQEPVTARGHCLCSGVKFEVRGPLRAVVYCHCQMCRRSSGHFVAATACAKEHLKIETADCLRWFQSSAQAKRGFCGVCGSLLFWMPADERHVSIMAGALDAPTGLRAVEHIFVAEAGDYYDISDDLPQMPGHRVG